MTDESKATPEHQNISTVWRILYIFGMLIYAGLAFVTVWCSHILTIWPTDYMITDMILNELSSKRMEFARFHFIPDAIIFWLFSLGLGFASFLFGYKVFVPVARHGWIKYKLMITAIISFLSVIFIGWYFPFYFFGKSLIFYLEAKYNLRDMFSACQTYWEEKGGDKICDLKVASQEEYGFVQSEYLNIDGKGTAKDFTATAQNKFTDNVFTIDAEGKTTDAKGKTTNGNDPTLRVYPSDVKSNLRLVYSACKAYWADEGSQKPCTLVIAKSEHYGFRQSSQVEFVVEQFLERIFFAKAKHKKMDVYYTIDSRGIITPK